MSVLSIISPWLTNLSIGLVGSSQLYQWYNRQILEKVRFSDDVTSALGAGAALAKANGRHETSTEAMLLGILLACPTSESVTLERTGIDLATACRALEFIAPQDITPGDHAIRALVRRHEQAAAEARNNNEPFPRIALRVRHAQILVRAKRAAYRADLRCATIDHLLLGILKDRRSKAAKLLRAHGVTPRLLRAEIRRSISAGRLDS